MEGAALLCKGLRLFSSEVAWRGASVLVYVSDMIKAENFYGPLLSTGPTHRDPTTVTFEIGNTRLILHSDQRPSRAAVRGSMAFNLEVEDIRAFFHHVKTQGIDAEPPVRMPWGWTLLSVKDPDGNEVEIYQVR
jgi:uncharacterized glyoxalase superfamily protein PhnB